MSDTELADICDEAVSDMEDSHAPYLTRIRNGLLEAAQRLRKMESCTCPRLASCPLHGYETPETVDLDI